MPVDTPAGPLYTDTDYIIDYRCDTPGPEIEEGTVEGEWTGEIDTWGKLTIRECGSDRELYLFPREIVGLE